MSKTIEIPAKIIRGAMVCQATNDIRFYLNAVAFDGDNGKVVATDGHILFIGKVESLKGAFEGVRILQIPQKISKDIEAVDFNVSNNTLQLKKYLPDEKVGLKVQPMGTQLNAKLIEADYPDYNAVRDSVSGDYTQDNRIGLRPELVKRAVNALELPKWSNHIWAYNKSYAELSCPADSDNNAQVIIMAMLAYDDAN